MSGVFNRILVLYPRGLQTGGPEALHQLVDELRSQGQDAMLVPLRETRNSARVAEYEVYDAPEAEDIDDRDGNAVIAPEGVMDRLVAVRRAQRVIWWLSIDYASPFLPRQEAADRRFARSLGARHQNWSNSLASAMYARMFARRPRRRLFESSVHLSQSQYARSTLLTWLGISASMVTDYIPRRSIDSVSMQEPGTRGITVAYNPKKAAWVPRLLGPSLPQVVWRPLEGLSHREVAELLAGTTAYFDPGFHPGRDRMPREAALLGAVTVVARRGSGAYWADTPVPWEHKVSVGASFVEAASGALGRVVEDPVAAVAAQQSYREWIGRDCARFREEIERVFVQGRWDDDSPSGVDLA